MLELINWSIGYSSHISVEIVDTTLADVGHIYQANCTEHSVPVSGKEELLLSDLHINSKCRSPSWGVECLYIVSGYDRHSPGCCEQCHDEYRFRHILPAIWTTFKVVPAAIIR
jgi:hypothetical protein